MQCFPRFGAAVVFALSVFSLPLQAQDATEEMSEAAAHFIERLTPEQHAKAVFPLKADERFDWHFVPKDRKGLPLKEMNKKQRDAAHAMLDSVLSHRGYVDATTIMSLESILHDLENDNPRRDSELYYVSIFGSPTNQTWGWRFEGHHLSLNFTVAPGHVSVTPTFWGSNPSIIPDGPRKGRRTLALEEDMGRALVKLLDADQLKKAIISTNAPREIVTGNQRKVKPLQPDGIGFNEMNREQGQQLLDLVKYYLNRYRAEIADEEWKKIQKAGWDGIHFAWAGGTEPGEGHYYRIQGPTFLVEYDNTQNNAHHVHTTWRDFENDFGEDILRKHYERDHRK